MFSNHFKEYLDTGVAESILPVRVRAVCSRITSCSNFSPYLPLQQRQENWIELTSAKTSGIVRREGKKKLANSRLAPPNKTIPETIAARISAPVPFSYLSGECHPVWVHERKSGNELWSLIVNYKTSLFENSLAITNVATLRSR